VAKAPNRAPRARRPIALVVVMAAVLTACLGAPPPPPATDADNATAGSYGWFEAGYQWRGQFADPDVVRIGPYYYAFSSGAGGRYLGVMRSSDLIHWYAHPRWSTSAAPWLGGPDPHTDATIPAEIRVANLTAGDMWNLNDALVRPSAWGVTVPYSTWEQRDYWAVGVIQLGVTWYAYAPVKYSNLLGDGTSDPQGFGRYCLTVATAPSPFGPFRDISGAHPFYCDPDPGGSIDPAPYLDAGGHPWLTWKAAGRRSRPGVSGYPSSLKAVRLDATGHMTGPIYTLLTTNEGSWEGYTIENPSMIYWHGHYYLFYSANSFLADRAGNSPYATGYAICNGPAGPCHRPSASPLMASTSTESGPGGASAFVDTAGNLRLAYASYWPGEYRKNTGIPQPRRMHIATIVYHANGTLTANH
jgi:beta-xylosidase